MVLEPLGGLEVLTEFPVLVPGCMSLCAGRQIADASFILGDGSVEPLQTGPDADHLPVLGGKVHSRLLPGRCRQFSEYLAGLFEPCNVSFAYLVGLLAELGHSLREVSFGREQALDLHQDIAGLLRALMEEFRSVTEPSQLPVDPTGQAAVAIEIGHSGFDTGQCRGGNAAAWAALVVMR